MNKFHRNLNLTNEPGDIVKIADLANCMSPCPTTLYEVFNITRETKSNSSLDYAKISFTYNKGFEKVVEQFVDRNIFLNSDDSVKHLIISDILERLYEMKIINPISISLN